MATLEFEVDIVSVSSEEDLKARQKEKESPLATRMDKAASLKEQGNQLFAQKDYRSACVVYKDAIGLVSLGAEAETEPERMQRVSLLVPLLLNLAQCLINEQLFSEAQAHLQSALSNDPRNAKALYRMAVCLKNQQKVDEALEYAGKARGVLDGKEVRQLIVQLKDLKKDQDGKSAKAYKNIFDNKTPVYDDEYVKKQVADAQAAKLTECTVCGEKMDKIQLARHIIKKHGDGEPK